MIDKLNALNRHIGQAVAWLNVAMVLWMAFTVLERYVLSTGYIWQQEVVRYLHAIIFMLAAGYTLQCDEHVRVDVLYQHASSRKKAFVNLFGTLFFLFPFLGTILYFSYEYVITSWSIWEPSPEPAGLPLVFLLKTLIWGYAVTLFLQGISLILKSFREIIA
jgi:TRAP-type mannitol/chloroaromatic compound transport system permease small subunit